MLPPVRDQAADLYNSVKTTVVTYTDKIRNDVGPTLKNVLKSSLDAVFTGVPQVIRQVTERALLRRKIISLVAALTRSS